MNNLDSSDLKEYVEKNIGQFHKTRLDNIKKLKLGSILKRKNPYLFKAKNITTAADLVRSVVDAHLSSGEETLFGEFLEGLAIYICQNIFNGQKSSAPGIDLEFIRDGIRYIVSIKSGPNWGNSRQIAKMKDDFQKAGKTIRTSKSNVQVVAVNGCCYGKDDKPDKGSYYKYCGQQFWEFISGDPSLFTKLIEPLGHKAKEKNDQFKEEYSRVLNIFTAEFIADFCDDGCIDWEKLVVFNSQ